MIIDTVAVWKEKLRKHAVNGQWFSEAAPEIYRDIQKGLRQIPQKREEFTGVLIATEPFLPTLGQLQPWRDLMVNAINVTSNSKNLALRCEIMIATGNMYAMYGDFERAEELFIKACDLAYENNLPRQVINSYIGMMNLSLNTYQRITYQDLPALLDYHPELRDSMMTGKLYLAIANACKQWAQFQTANDYAKMAYVYWLRQNNYVEVGRSAKILTITSIYLRNFSEAESWLEIAEQCYSKTDYIWQYSEILYLKGQLANEHQNFDESLEYLQKALEEFKKLDDPNKHAVAYHAIAQAHIHKRQFEQAEANLAQADDIAQKTNNTFQRLHILHTNAYMNAKRDRRQDSLEQIKVGLEVLSSLQNETQFQMLQQKFEELQQMIINDDPQLS
ncbi:MAG: tetratricopeptide repeat protein [Anaerolineae bacterium]|nr:tetratricopeptide repeat protein [Anaerolineae bacterium]